MGVDFAFSQEPMQELYQPTAALSPQPRPKQAKAPDALPNPTSEREKIDQMIRDSIDWNSHGYDYTRLGDAIELLLADRMAAYQKELLADYQDDLREARNNALEETLGVIADMEASYDGAGRTVSKGEIKKWLEYELEIIELEGK